MSSGLENIACPRCGAVFAVPAAMVGQVCTCSQCRLMFLPPRVAPVAGPLPPHLLAGPLPPMSPVLSPALRAAVASNPEVLSASPPAKKHAPLFSSGTWLELILFILMATVVVGGIGLAWLYWKGKDALVALQEPEPEPEAKAQAQPEEIEEIAADSPPRWSDASAVSLLCRGVKLRIDHAEFAEILAKDDEHHVLPTDGQKYLAVYLTVKNLGKEPVEYHSWYTHGGRTPPKLQPTLTDGAGHTFPLKKFTGVAQIKGHTPQAKLAHNDEINDTIIFRVPDEVPRDEVQFLRLQLSAAAHGGDGTYRFEIPRSMVSGW